MKQHAAQRQGKPSFISISPLFLVGDLDEAAAYYCDALGFEKNWAWGDPPIRIGVSPRHFLESPGFELHLINDPDIGPAATSFAYITMVGVDDFYRKCVANGANIFLELGERPWKMKDFRVIDPFGNRLGFGEALD